MAEDTVRFISGLLQDLRYGCRAFARNRESFIVSIITLSLGIGANVAVFSVVNAVFLCPLPYKDPDKLVMIQDSDKSNGRDQISLAPARFLDLQGRNKV